VDGLHMLIWNRTKKPLAIEGREDGCDLTSVHIYLIRIVTVNPFLCNECILIKIFIIKIITLVFYMQSISWWLPNFYIQPGPLSWTLISYIQFFTWYIHLMSKRHLKVDVSKNKPLISLPHSSAILTAFPFLSFFHIYLI
jgi:hypothetical protein